jgi:hypothetical protein
MNMLCYSCTSNPPYFSTAKSKNEGKEFYRSRIANVLRTRQKCTQLKKGGENLPSGAHLSTRQADPFYISTKGYL